MLANGSQLPLALAVPCRQVLASSAPQLGELWTASRCFAAHAKKKANNTIRINLFVVVGVIRLIIVAVIIANTIIIIIIRIRQFRPMLMDILNAAQLASQGVEPPPL